MDRDADDDWEYSEGMKKIYNDFLASTGISIYKSVAV
jgi:hypothetical protein